MMALDSLKKTKTNLCTKISHVWAHGHVRGRWALHMCWAGGQHHLHSLVALAVQLTHCKFIPTIQNFWDFELHQPTFQTYYVEIWPNLGNTSSTTQNFVTITRDTAQGLPVLHCPVEVMHI